MNVIFNGGRMQLIVETVDTVIKVDCEDCKYERQPDSTYKCIFRDVGDDELEQMAMALEDMVYYRQRDFESTTLIENLIVKLPEDSRIELIQKLKSYE